MEKVKVFRTLWLSLIVSVFIINCSKDGSSQPRLGPAPKKGLGQCENTPSEGADLASSSIKNKFEDSGYFQKSLRLSQLNAALKSSAKSITDLLVSQGVQVYAVEENTESSCFYFHYLNLATPLAQKHWNDSRGPEDQDTKLLGLFTYFYSKNLDNQKVSIKDPTIILRQDTEKWTLLHEMNHFLFAQGRTQHKSFQLTESLQNQLYSEIDNYNLALGDYQAQPSAERGIKILDALSKVYELNMELDRRGPLEEFSADSILVDRYADGLIEGVPQSELWVAFKYMLSNSDVVFPTYENLHDRFARLARTFELDGFFDLAEHSQNRADTLLSTMSFINDKLDKAFSLAQDSFENEGSARQLQWQETPFHYDIKATRDRHRTIRQM